jgi:hypothetical protein
LHYFQPILETSDLSHVFDVFNSSTASLVEVGCQVIGVILELVEPAILISR